MMSDAVGMHRDTASALGFEIREGFLEEVA